MSKEIVKKRYQNWNGILKILHNIDSLKMETEMWIQKGLNEEDTEQSDQRNKGI